MGVLVAVFCWWWLRIEREGQLGLDIADNQEDRDRSDHRAEENATAAECPERTAPSSPAVKAG